MQILLIDNGSSYSTEVQDMIETEIGLVCDKANDLDSAARHIEAKNYDLIVIEINEDNQGGILNFINNVQDSCQYIFICDDGQEDLYLQTSKIKNSLFLVQPIAMVTLKSAIEKSKHVMEANLSLQKVTLKSQRKILSIPVKEIRFLKTDSNYCTVATTHEEIKVRDKLDNILEKIDSPEIIRIHRQYAVNIIQITEADIPNNYVTLNDDTFPIGRKYKKSFAGILSN